MGTERSPVEEAAWPRTMNDPDLGPHAPVMGCRHDISINRENSKSLSHLHIPLLPHGGGRAGEEAGVWRQIRPSQQLRAMLMELLIA